MTLLYIVAGQPIITNDGEVLTCQCQSRYGRPMGGDL